MRTVRVEGTSFLINGKPFYFKGFGKHEDSAFHGRGMDDYDYGEEDSEEWETEDEESDEPDADGGSTEEDDEDSVK